MKHNSIPVRGPIRYGPGADYGGGEPPIEHSDASALAAKAGSSSSSRFSSLFHRRGNRAAREDRLPPLPLHTRREYDARPSHHSRPRDLCALEWVLTCVSTLVALGIVLMFLIVGRNDQNEFFGIDRWRGVGYRWVNSVITALDNSAPWYPNQADTEQMMAATQQRYEFIGRSCLPWHQSPCRHRLLSEGKGNRDAEDLAAWRRQKEEEDVAVTPSMVADFLAKSKLELWFIGYGDEADILSSSSSFTVSGGGGDDALLSERDKELLEKNIAGLLWERPTIALYVWRIQQWVDQILLAVEGDRNGGTKRGEGGGEGEGEGEGSALLQELATEILSYYNKKDSDSGSEEAEGGGGNIHQCMIKKGGESVDRSAVLSSLVMHNAGGGGGVGGRGSSRGVVRHAVDPRLLFSILQDTNLEQGMPSMRQNRDHTNRATSREELLPGGFIRATGFSMLETESVRPMDDLSILQVRYRSLWYAWQRYRGAVAQSNSQWEDYTRFCEMQRALSGSSLLNRRYYYPVRRYRKMKPYASYTYVETIAFEEAVQLYYDVLRSASTSAAAGRAKKSKQKVKKFLILPLDPARASGIEKTLLHPQKDVLPPQPFKEHTNEYTQWTAADRKAAAQVESPTIFISIASYRDKECGVTVLDAFRNAKTPFRLYAGIAEQHFQMNEGDAAGRDAVHDATCISEDMYDPILAYQLPGPVDHLYHDDVPPEDWYREDSVLPSYEACLRAQEEGGSGDTPPHHANEGEGSNQYTCWRGEAARRFESAFWTRRHRDLAFPGRPFPPEGRPDGKSGRSDRDWRARRATRMEKLRRGGGGRASTSTEEEAMPDSRDIFTNHVRGLFIPAENVRRRRIDPRHAKGPTFGRYMAMLLYRGEDFALIIDSHHRFVPHWDVMAAYWFKFYRDKRAVLSHYPEAFEGSEDKKFNFERSSTAYLCKAKFLSDVGYVRLDAIVVSRLSEYQKNNDYMLPFKALASSSSSNDDVLSDVTTTSTDENDDQQPSKDDVLLNNIFKLPQPWIAGGFLFAGGILFREVPFDPHLPHLFDGEEVLFGVRLWTHGYNLYSPVRNLAFHIYYRSKAPKIWDETHDGVTPKRNSQKRVQYLLQSRFNDPGNQKGKTSHRWFSAIGDFKTNANLIAAADAMQVLDATRPRIQVFGWGVTEPGSLVVLDETAPLSNEEMRRQLQRLVVVPSHSKVNDTGASVQTAYSRFLASLSAARFEDAYLLWWHRYHLVSKMLPEEKKRCIAFIPSPPHISHSVQHPLPEYIKVDLTRYGLGRERDLRDWYVYAGVDPILYEVDGRWCGKTTR